MKSNTFLIINDSIVNTDSTIYRISKSLINNNKNIIIISKTQETPYSITFFNENEKIKILPLLENNNKIKFKIWKIQISLNKFYNKIKKYINSILDQKITLYLEYLKYLKELSSYYIKNINNIDIIIVKGLINLPLGATIAKKKKVPLVLYLIEYYFDESENEEWKKQNLPLLNFIAQNYLNYVNKIILYDKEIEFLYKEYIYNVLKLNKNFSFEIIKNYPFYHDLQPKQITNNEIKFVYSGLLAPERKLEKMIFALKKLKNNFTMTFYGISYDKNYLNYLRSLVNEDNRFCFLDPVPYEKLIETLNQYDVGLNYLEPNNLNHLHATTYKVSEYIQARLALVGTPNTGMKKIILENKVGLVSSDFSIESFYKTLNKLTPPLIMNFKNNSHQAAKKLNWNNEEKKLINLLNNL